MRSAKRLAIAMPVVALAIFGLVYLAGNLTNPSKSETQACELLPPSSVVLNVKAAELGGSPIEDIYVAIGEDNAILLAGNTPLGFSANRCTTYTVGASLEEILKDVSYTFNHWDNGSTARTRTVIPTSQITNVTAYYRANTEGWATVTVNSAELSGLPLPGISVTISPAVQYVMSGDTPLTLTLASDTAYTLSPQDYGSYEFDHWEDETTDRARTITPTGSLDFIAYFKSLPSSGDTTVPSVAVSSPSAGQNLTSSSPTLSGTASDNVGITKVEVSVDGGDYEVASGLATWSFSMMGLTDGLHSASVRVSDAAGNNQLATVDFAINASAVLGKTGVFVPLYVYPSPGNMAHYNTIIKAKLAHPSVPIVVAINPAGGPGNTTDNNYANAVDSLQDAGVVVIGYVPTTYGSRDINAVKSDIDDFVSWYNIDGIHIDEVSNDVGYESYYTELTAYGKSHGLKIMIGNAGTDVPQSYVGTVDSIGITEGPGYAPMAWLQYCVLCTTSGWHYNFDKNEFWMQRYNVEKLDTQYALEASKWVGMMYFTDGVSPVRWDHVPPYFDTLVATLDVP